MSAPNTTEQATVTIPGARVAPDAYARADARAAEAMPGNIHPLGPTPAEHLGKVGTNFSIASSVAEGVTLCLFDEHGAETQIPLRDNDADVWHAFVPGVGPGQAYGYYIRGPYKPEQGLRFNHHKMLVDPYARDFVGRLRWSDALYAYTVGHKREDLSFDRRDSAAFMPKGRVLESAFTWGDDRPPRVPWHDTVIYEAHVRGATMRHPEVPPPLRGTYAGLATAPMIEPMPPITTTAKTTMMMSDPMIGLTCRMGAASTPAKPASAAPKP